MNEIKICEHCGQRIAEYKVSLSKLMINTLVKFRMAILEKGENNVHLLKDFEGRSFELTRHEWNNFSRLRYHGLAVQVEGQSGNWLLTRRGSDFLNGKVSIPKYVWVKNGHITERSGEFVFIRDVVADAPYLEKLEDIVYRSFEPVQTSMI